jgi:flagellar motor protein MotB
MDAKPVFEERNQFSDDHDVMEKMTASFQTFMLQGKSKGKTSATTSPLITTMTHQLGSTTSDVVTSTSAPTRTNQYYNKSIRPIVKAFQSRLQDWNHTDRQLEKVLRSIANLQMRLAGESHLHRRHEQQRQQDDSRQEKPWVGSGFRTHAAVSGIFLTRRDIDMALDHDLLQYERMLATLRSFMASMSQSLDALSRRLEEWMHIHWNNVGQQQQQQQQHWQQQQEPLLEDAQQLYRLLAEDLYRKQVAVQRVLESSCHDRLLDFEDTPSTTVNEATPQDTSKQALKEWTSSPIQKQKDSLMGLVLQLTSR